MGSHLGPVLANTMTEFEKVVVSDKIYYSLIS